MSAQKKKLACVSFPQKSTVFLKSKAIYTSSITLYSSSICNNGAERLQQVTFLDIRDCFIYLIDSCTIFDPNNHISDGGLVFIGVIWTAGLISSKLIVIWKKRLTLPTGKMSLFAVDLHSLEPLLPESKDENWYNRTLKYI